MCDITITDVVRCNRNPDNTVADYELEVYELRGIPYREGMEDSLRYAHQAWLAAGAAVESERQRLEAAILAVAEKIRNGGTTND